MYIARQLTGPIAAGIEPAALGEFSPSLVEINYFRDISIDTAEADVLWYIGMLVGIPWPICPTGTFDNGMFALSSAAAAPEFSVPKGLASVSVLGGGLLSSVSENISVRCPIGQYRTLLKIVAMIKANGFGLKAVDDLIGLFTLDYTIAWNASGDVVATFSVALDTGSLYIVQKILDLFMMDFRVSLVQP
jgi:hypothetical protein